MSEAELQPKQIVDEIITDAADRNASDVHLDVSNETVKILLRIDGVLQEVRTIDDALAVRVGNRIMYLAGLKTYQTDLPQEGRIEGEAVGINGYIRVSCYPTLNGTRIALRLHMENREVMGLDNLNFPDKVLDDLKKFLTNPGGALLLTGPSGSGKTTTIYACLNELKNKGDKHIVTIEDPAECMIEGIMQTQIKPEAGLFFAEALKRLLRQDPEVIAVGEIRDRETADIAFQAALTGHKMISTLHAGSAVEVIIRLLDIGIEPHIVSSALDLVIAQRLIRKTCKECEGKGCESCRDTGYSGRVPVAESIVIDNDLKLLIKHSPDENELKEYFRDKGCKSLTEHAQELKKRKLTTADEISRVIGDGI